MLQMSRRMVVVRGTTAVGALMAAGFGGPAEAKVEQPEYTLISAEGEFETRDYSVLVVAQFTKRGSYRNAVELGYITLEKYYLGANTTPEPIAMTTPTMVRDDLAAGWTTMLALPRQFRIHSAPVPNDRRVRLVEIPARRVAAIKFPGKLNEMVMRDQQAVLTDWLAAHGIAHQGDFTLAGYDGAWVPTKWRANEVLVTLK